MAKKILVADDDFKQRDLYVELFKNKGYHVISADDGLEALEIALKERPDLIFTGIIMPRMDGFELIRNLRSNVATADAGIIMFSHLGREEDRQKASQVPRVVFMVKGYDSPSAILEKVEEMLDHRTPGRFSPHSEAEADIRPPRTTI
jgi:CheY-like chemotaxis protein